jgi:uncharacterized membrane protein
MEDAIRRAQNLYPGLCLSQSYELFRAQFSQVVVATLLVTAVSWSVGAVPYFGILLSGAIHGVLYGGLYAFFLKLIRGGKPEIGDTFSGFSRDFPQLLLVGGATSILTVFVMTVLAVPFLLAMLPAFISFFNNPDSGFPAAPGFLALAGMCTAIGAGFLCALIWMFAVPLVMDRKMEFWPAMELSRKVTLSAFGRIAGLLLISGLVAFSGMLLCGVGMFFTMPIAFGAIAYAYNDIFGGPGDGMPGETGG